MTIDKNPIPACSPSSFLKTKDSPQCAVCESSGHLLYKGLKDHLFGAQGEYSYRRCNNIHCGLIWQDSMPVTEDLAKAYDNYYTHAEKKKQPAKLGRRIARLPANLLDALLIRLLGIRKKRKSMRYLGLEDSPPGRMLEIGCGRGERLGHFSDIGWETIGQDIDSKAVAHVKATRGIEVLCGELTSLCLDSAQFDAIVMSHVLEHVPDVKKIISECFRLLKSGGRLIILTPNAESLGHQKFGKNWRGLEPPRHLHILSKNNLQAVLDQHGFRQVSVQTNAASARALFEASYLLQEGIFTHKERHPPIPIYYKALFLQYKEWLMSKNSPQIGEELFAHALKW